MAIRINTWGTRPKKPAEAVATQSQHTEQPQTEQPQQTGQPVQMSPTWQPEDRDDVYTERELGTLFNPNTKNNPLVANQQEVVRSLHGLSAPSGGSDAVDDAGGTAVVRPPVQQPVAPAQPVAPVQQPVVQQPAAQPRRATTMLEILEALNPQLTAEERAKKDKRDKQRAFWSALGDGIAALANLGGTVHGAYDSPAPQLSQQNAARLDRLTTEAKNNWQNYQNAYLKAWAGDRDFAEERERWAKQWALRQQEAARAEEQHGWKRELFPLERATAEANKALADVKAKSADMTLKQAEKLEADKKQYIYILGELSAGRMTEDAAVKAMHELDPIYYDSYLKTKAAETELEWLPKEKVAAIAAQGRRYTGGGGGHGGGGGRGRGYHRRGGGGYRRGGGVRYGGRQKTYSQIPIYDDTGYERGTIYDPTQLSDTQISSLGRWFVSRNKKGGGRQKEGKSWAYNMSGTIQRLLNERKYKQVAVALSEFVQDANDYDIALELGDEIDRIVTRYRK